MPSYENAFAVPESLLERTADDRQSLMRRELEEYLVNQCQQQLAAASTWSLNYQSPAAYRASCEEHRARWSRTIGEVSFVAPFNARYEPFFEDETAVGQWLFIDLDDQLVARAALVLPKVRAGKLPLVIAQHGIGSSPERVLGFNDPTGYYHGYGRALVEAGYAVLAPSNITNAAPRARLQRLCLLLGKTLAGLEVGKIRRLIDFAGTLPEIDPTRIGMWGLSLGGMYTMFTAPLEER
ncbi:MAG: hypothetical protein KDE58_40185, partial [Caldilineaceae bacterium]|nr:hypothetical protein [Caldilineaceae bacterium]